MSLHDRIAAAIGWPVSEVRRFSLLSLRDIVRPVSAKLAHECTLAAGAAPVFSRAEERILDRGGVTDPSSHEIF